MAKRRDNRPPTFSEIVDQENARDVDPQEGTFAEVDHAGRGLLLVNDSITSERAYQLVVDGAAVAWDSCGSRGFAGEVVWIDEADLQSLAAAGPPKLRRKKNHRHANLMEYRREDGRPVVIAEMSVRWGKLMD